MLCRLAISNIAVIEKAEITFGEGFTVLTGETGAGKSLIMDAITMVLGGRTGRDIIRAGQKCAICEAAFFGPHPLADETEMLLLRRELYADGRNLCSINGNMVTVAGLREAAEPLLAMHGQHDTEQLLHKSSHLIYVDKFAHADAEREVYTQLYAEKKRLLAEIDALEADAGEKSRRLEMLTFWTEEIRAAAPVPGEDTELEGKREILRHSETIRRAAMGGYMALCGEDAAARDSLSAAARALDGGGVHDARLMEAAEKIRDAQYQIEEIAALLFDISEEEHNGAALEEIEDRLDVLQKLKHKYGGSIEAVLRYADEAEEEKARLETADETLAALQISLAETEKKLMEAAKALSAKRAIAAGKIADAAEKELKALDMEKVRFSVSVQEKAYGETGADEVEFFISTNPAEGVKPLSKIASGGELSRVCLALQTVLAENAIAPPAVMIFDEIDTGISGRAAQKTGEKLRALARNRQILCVTHLPQIAAKADAQFLIEKKEKDGGFSTMVRPLDKAGRIEAIARMISGDSLTDKTRETAEEMLK